MMECETIADQFATSVLGCTLPFTGGERRVPAMVGRQLCRLSRRGRRFNRALSQKRIGGVVIAYLMLNVL